MKSALGRGLQSLIPQKKETKSVKDSKVSAKLRDLAKLKKESIFNIEIDKIVANPNQPRKNIGMDELKELAASIKEYGILQPLIVNKVERFTDRGGRQVEYELVAGERRWRAAQLAKLPRVPVIIRDDSKQMKLEVALVENIQREDLNPIETALAYERLHKEFCMSHQEIAQKIGKDRSTVTNILRLLTLPSGIKNAIADGRITEGHGRALLMAKPEARFRIFRDVIRNNRSIGYTESKAREVKRESSFSFDKGPKNVLFREMEGKLQAIIGRRVSITKRIDRGHLSIEFKDQKELDKLFKHLLKI